MSGIKLDRLGPTVEKNSLKPSAISAAPEKTLPSTVNVSGILKLEFFVPSISLMNDQVCLMFFTLSVNYSL